MPGISNKFASIPSRKISRYKIWKENTVVGFIYMMASYHMKIRSVQIPINIETKNSNIAFEYLLVLHLLHSILKAAGVIEASLLYESERKEKVPHFQTNITSVFNANVINGVYFVWYIVELSHILMI